MRKKILDIVPPKEEFPKKVNLKDNEGESREKAGFGVEREKNRFPWFFIKAFGVLFLVLAIGGGLLFSLLFARAKIEISPETEILTLKTKVNVAPAALNAYTSVKDNSIPGKIFEDERTISRKFFSSGKALKERRAEGIIRVYNNYSTSPQPLLPNTRFVSDKGKLFRSTKREVIAGGHYEKGKFVAGFTDIKVRAAEPGEEYNIGPSAFSIPGFRGTPKYTYFYGKSFSPMAGGFKGEVPQVTLEDINNSEDALVKEVEEESRDFLKKTLSDDYILLDRAVFQNVVEKNASAQVGAEAESFEVKVKIRSQGIGFKKSDIKNFVKDFINSSLPKEKTFQESSIKIDYLVDDSFSGKDSSSKDNKSSFPEKIVLDLVIRVKTYQKVNLNDLKKAISGKTTDEARIFLENLSYVKNVNVNNFFLKKRIPEDIHRIDIKMNLD
ncbi:MAG TPA: hypothetical protein ENL27_02035 [Candidatus Parcubacteria bacterium]|nr:hypothetical protein [Candidatus Parcubacteria bacterium]